MIKVAFLEKMDASRGHDKVGVQVIHCGKDQYKKALEYAKERADFRAGEDVSLLTTGISFTYPGMKDEILKFLGFGYFFFNKLHLRLIFYNLFRL